MTSETASPSNGGPTSTSKTTTKYKQEISALDIQRQSLETEANDIVSELTSTPPNATKPMGIDTPLTDADGYPRSDIDLYRARVLRKRLNEVRTDHKEIMKKLEHYLLQSGSSGKDLPNEKKGEEEYDEEELRRRLEPKPKPKFDPVSGKWVVRNWDGTIAGAEGGDERCFDDIPDSHTIEKKATATAQTVTSPVVDSNTTAAPTPTIETPTLSPTYPQPLIPFAIIDVVFPHSPAFDAGLHEGDLVIRFGNITHANHNDLRAIAELVPQAAADSSEISISVLRRRRMSVDDDVVHGVEAGVRVPVVVGILPKPWEGRGMLGCHIVQYNELTEASYVEPT